MDGARDPWTGEPATGADGGDSGTAYPAGGAQRPVERPPGGAPGADPAAETSAVATGVPAADGADGGDDGGRGDRAGDGAAADDRGRRTWWLLGRRRRGRTSFWRELPILIVIALGLALLIKAFLLQAFYIPSGSMEPTLHGCPGCSGDRVLVNKLVYDFRDPHRGEIVVFKGPPSWEPEVQFSEPTNPFSKVLRGISSAFGFAPPGEKDFIKRVIGVGGDTVACCDAQGRVTVNGHPLTEPYIYPGNKPSDTPFRVTVPKGRIFVLGDHRAASADSRYHLGDHDGTVPVDNVIGRAFLRVWPPSRWGTLSVPATFDQKGLAMAAAPYALGVVGTLPVALVRRRRRRRRVGGRAAPGN